MKSYLLLLLLPVCAAGKDLYHLQPLSEQEVRQTYVRILLDACLHADADWKRSAFDPTAGYWGDGVSRGNEGIRAIGEMVLAGATLVKYDPGLSDGERRELLSKTVAALRYVTATHLTGTQTCTDGKKWGGADRPHSPGWQSTYWTGTIAFGSWLVWPHLEPALRAEVERVVAAQDDFLTQGDPPTGLWSDTKAEENGWDVPGLVLGEVMFPGHPHAAAWHEKAVQYMMNTLCTADDLNDASMVDGRAVNRWVRGANLQPDFTLENHNIFHPAYVACSSYFLTQAALYYTYAGRPVPPAATHHLMDTWRMFRTIVLPWGEAAYPQGMDWELHGLSYLNLFASLGSYEKDPFATRLEQQCLQYVRAWQLMRQGDLTVPGSSLGFTRHATCAEQVSYAFLAHQVFGAPVPPLTARAAAAQSQGAWDYRYEDFIVHRTEQKWVSFSWKNRIMGQLVPLGEGHGGNPEFTVPIADGFVGSFALAPQDGAKATVGEHFRKITPSGFETAGTLLLGGGRLRQTLKVSSIGNQAVVYQDRVTALAEVAVTEERGVPLGIENDEITGGTRVVSDQDGQTVFDWQKPRPPLVLRGSWANVDGRLGVVMVAGAGLTYAQGSGYLRGISVCADVLYASRSDRPRQFKAGELVARRVVVFFAEVGPAETSSLARSCRIEETRGGQVLHFQQPGGARAEVPLP